MRRPGASVMALASKSGRFVTSSLRPSIVRAVLQTRTRLDAPIMSAVMFRRSTISSDGSEVLKKDGGTVLPAAESAARVCDGNLPGAAGIPTLEALVECGAA